MSTIADQISRLQSDSTAIASAIEAKGVTVPSGSGYDDYASLIANIPTGGGSEFDDWVLDGDTHLWINIVHEDQLTLSFRFRMVGTIVWGDGNTYSANSTTNYTTYTHTYSALGRYRVDLKPNSGTTFLLGGASTNYNVMGPRSNATMYKVGTLYQVEIGSNVITTLSNYAFYYCYGLQKVYVPKTITTIGSSVFYMCYALQEAVFEDSSTITSTTIPSMFYYNYNLQHVEFAPPGVTAMSSTYRWCYSLTEVTIPATVTSIAANTFNNCYCLKLMKCLPTTPPTVAAASAFTNIPTSCVIQVPSASLSAYQSASQWSTYASQMVGV